jgi:hypothetical protein
MDRKRTEARLLFLASVEAPDFLDWNGLGSNLQRRKLGRVDELLHILPKGPIERLFVRRQ